MVERLAFCLGERLGAENVAAHHGSLSRKLRLEAERKLKNGEIRLLVATASLELGIDIGSIDLVCQVNSPRAIAAAMQRVGRAGHWRGAIPKGRFFVTTRDDLMESAALIRAMRAGVLDRLEIPALPDRRADAADCRRVRRRALGRRRAVEVFAARIRIASSRAKSMRRLSACWQTGSKPAAGAMGRTCCATAYTGACSRGAARAPSQCRMAEPSPTPRSMR